MDKEIKIRLTIDGKEAIAVLNLTDTNVQQLLRTAQQFNTNPMLKQFAKDLLEIEKVSEEASQGILEFIKYNNISERQIEEVVRALQEEKSVLGATSKEYAQHQTALANLSNAYGRLKSAQTTSLQVQSHMSTNLSGMNMLIGQTGFLMSDLDMFFVNWRMGWMSIGNNISMIANTFGIAVSQAQAAGMTIGQAFSASITPINIMLISVNGLLLIMNALSRAFDDGSESIMNQKKTLQDLVSEYQDFGDVIRNIDKEISSMRFDELDILFDKLQQRLQDLNRIAPRLIDQIWQGLTFKPLTDYFGINNWFVDEIQRTPVVFGEAGKDKKAIAETETAIERIKKRSEELKKTLSTQLKLGSIAPGELKQMKKDLDDILDSWEKNVKQKTIGIGDQFKGTFIEIGTYNRTAVEKLGQDIDKYLNPKVKEATLNLNQMGNVFDKIIDRELKTIGFSMDDMELPILPDAKISEVIPSQAQAKRDNELLNLLPGDQLTEKRISDRYSKGLEIKLKPKKMEGTDVDNIRSATDILNESLNKLSPATQLLGQMWQRTGQIMANALSRAITQGKKFGDVIKEIGASLLDTALQMLIQVGMKALGTALGIPPVMMANGGIIAEPVIGVGLNSGQRYVLGEGGENELVTPMSKMSRLFTQPSSFVPRTQQVVRVEFSPIQITGNARARGRDLDFSFNKEHIIKKKYY